MCRIQLTTVMLPKYLDSAQIRHHQARKRKFLVSSVFPAQWCGRAVVYLLPTITVGRVLNAKFLIANYEFLYKMQSEESQEKEYTINNITRDNTLFAQRTCLWSQICTRSQSQST